MKVEGTMPFDAELGRMSEHMLVLLCRVQHYKVRAPDVLDFADGNVQFAVQLLLAILLKEPPYEFELRFVHLAPPLINAPPLFCLNCEIQYKTFG